MDDGRLPKQLLFGSLLIDDQTVRKPGKALKPWIDYVREDLHELKVPYTWDRLVQDRNKWRNKIHMLLEHIQPSAGM